MELSNGHLGSRVVICGYRGSYSPGSNFPSTDSSFSTLTSTLPPAPYWEGSPQSLASHGAQCTDLSPYWLHFFLASFSFSLKMQIGAQDSSEYSHGRVLLFSFLFPLCWGRGGGLSMLTIQFGSTIFMRVYILTILPLSLQS